MRHLKTYESFNINESWKPSFDRQTIFDAIPWYDNNRDLYPGYSAEEDQNMASDEYWFDSKEKAEQYADDLIDLFDSLPDPIPLYRAISAKEAKDIDLEYPGESWSYDRDSAYNFGLHNHSNYMLTAKIKKEDVNWAGTIKAYVLFSGGFTDEDENEIVVDEQSNLIDVQIGPLRKKVNEAFNNNLKEFTDRMDALEKEYKDKGVQLELQLGGYQSVYLSKIVVPQESREEGIGSAFMKKLTDLADEYGVYLQVSPANTYGGTVSRLKKFYNRFGFVDNKGRKRDDRFWYEMLRAPKDKRYGKKVNESVQQKDAWQMTREEWIAAGKPDHGMNECKPTFSTDIKEERKGIADYVALFDDPTALIKDSVIGVPRKDMDIKNRDKAFAKKTCWHIVKSAFSTTFTEDAREAIITGRLLGYPEKHILGYIFRNYILKDTFGGDWQTYDEIYKRFKNDELTKEEISRIKKAYPTLKI